MKVEIYDTTLRDGAQGAGIAYNTADKIKIIRALDALGADYIEAGNFASEPDMTLFRMAPTLGLTHAKLAAFGSTRRAYTTVESDDSLTAAAATDIPVITVFGKASAFQVRHILRAPLEENLSMIADTVAYLKAAGKEVIFDAEHFFDGYSDDPAYALEVLDCALTAGADAVVLCDTNGGMLPDSIGVAVTAVKNRFPTARVGIHCHNDMGMAAAASVTAILSGACQVQGTVSGIGERCGNANLNTILPVLQLKLGFDCIAPDRLAKLTAIAREINELANRAFDDSEPFVGGYAFTHKAGMHIDAVGKEPRSFEHITPESVGNERNILISELSGRAALRMKMCTLIPGLTKDSPEVIRATEYIRKLEAEGYQYESAEASLMLRIREALGIRKRYYDLQTFQVLISEPKSTNSASLCNVLIKISVDGREEITAAEGHGPVNALDNALRRALVHFYPAIANVRLTDYKVRVLESGDATASRVRVFIESTDGNHIWRTIGVSEDIIDASWQALGDAMEYRLSMDE